MKLWIMSGIFSYRIPTKNSSHCRCYVFYKADDCWIDPWNNTFNDRKFRHYYFLSFNVPKEFLPVLYLTFQVFKTHGNLLIQPRNVKKWAKTVRKLLFPERVIQCMASAIHGIIHTASCKENLNIYAFHLLNLA